MSTLKELIAQKNALEQQIAQARKSELADAVAKVTALIEEFDLTVDDIFPSEKSRAKNKSFGKVAPKYLDPLSGKTWTGRGVAPKWIEGQDRDAFLIVKSIS